MNTKTLWERRRTWLGVLVAGSGIAHAQIPSIPSLDVRQQGDQQERRQQERSDAQRGQLQRSPDELSAPAASSGRMWPDAETPCFVIREIVLREDPEHRFSWLLDGLIAGPGAAVGRCLGVAGINVAADRAQRALLERGYSTSRVLLQPQDLAAGVLTLTLVPGRIRAIRFAEPDARATAVNAVAMKPGDILNLRDIEQSLENFKRVPTVEADIKIEPGGAPGESDVVVYWKQGIPFRVSMTVDDSGTKATGKYQGTTTLSYDQWWTLNDLFYVTFILNNSRTNVQTQLGGFVAANPWLATGPARVILNEVNSSNPSQLKGYVEVAGSRAEVIIANPAGIQVNGGGFINASGVTLTTGMPVMNSGNLESFRVQRGQVNVEGLGLDTRTADYTAILARAAQVNAGVWAKDVTVVTGANDVKATATGAAATATAIAGSGPAPAFMLDVAAIGGMYAGKIYLVGTEAGLGVNNRGTLSADTQLVLLANGQLVNIGTGRIYGDHVSIGVNTLLNDSETVNGVRSDAVIAARTRLDIGAGVITNREHSLIISAGSGADALNIGGALDAQGHATGTATTLNNNSATIESLGGARNAAIRINNTNEHFATEVQQISPTISVVDYTLGAGDVYRGNDLSTHYSANAIHLWTCESTCITVNATGDTSDSFSEYHYDSTPYETVITRTDPARIVSGGAMGIVGGTILNDRSEVLAGGALTVAAADVQNTSVAGEKRFVNSGYVTEFHRVATATSKSSGGANVVSREVISDPIATTTRPPALPAEKPAEATFNAKIAEASQDATNGTPTGVVTGSSRPAPSLPPSILDVQGNLPAAIGGLGTPIPMPASADPSATAKAFARAAFNGQTPDKLTPILGGDSWVAKLPDGTVVTFRVAGDASAATEATTATVEINSSAIRAINGGNVAKFKFPNK